MNTGPLELKLQHLRERMEWIPLFVLIIGLAGTALGAWYVASTTFEKDQARFETEAQDAIEEIERRLTNYESLLRGGAGFFAAEPHVTKGEFAQYVDRLDLPRLYPGIQGIGFSTRVPRTEVAELESEMAQYYPDFHVWPPVEDEYVHAIQYLEPLDRRNRAAIGYNMFSETTRRRAMERARDSGAPAASGIVQLVQEIDENRQAGFLIYLPLYETDEIPEDLFGRRRALRGFVYAAFRADDLLADIFGVNQPSIAFRIFDGPQIDPSRLLHVSPSWAEVERQEDVRYELITRMRVAGRVWTVEVASLPGFVSTDPESSATWIALIGVMLSIVLFVLTRSQTKARIAAEKAAADLRRSERVLRRTEARVRNLIESNIIGIVLGGADGTISEANDAFLSMVGRQNSEVREGDLTLRELSASDPKEVLDYAFTELLRKGKFGPFEHSFRRPSGTFPALVGMALVDKSPLDWVAFVLDLTDRKHMETQLIEQKETLETLNRVQQVVSAELQVDHVLAAVTGAAASLASADEAAFFHRDPLAESDYVFVSPGHDRSDGPRIDREHPVVAQALEESRLDGSIREDPMGDDVLAVPVVSRFGTVVGTLVVAGSNGEGFSERDRQVVAALSAQAAIAVDNARLYEDARRDRNRAEEANAAKDQFLANLSHELRTPMTAIIGWVKMLQIGGLDENEYEEAITAIARSAQAQAQLIEDILDVSRIATGKMKIDRHPLDLRDVVDAAVDSVWPTAEARGIELVCALPEEPVPAEGDSQRLQQVVWNLLSNAVKFTSGGGRIEVDLSRHDEDAVITVSDTGEGIDPTALPFIFERFRQADGTTTRTFGGLGLGLSLVDYLVRAHGGSASAASDGVGKGSRFTVILPVTDSLEPSDVREDSGSKKGLSLAGRRLLVVEDDREVRELVQVILRHAGAEVVSVEDARQAMDHLANQNFDLMLSDIAMPGESGIGLIRKVRSRGGNALSIPAIALTAYAAEEDRHRILEAGYDGYLMKPLDPSRLVRAIRDLLARG